MKLFEFFGSMNVSGHDPRDTNQDGKLSREEKEQFKNDLFFSIIDNDDIHKKHFYDVTETIFKDKECNEEVWMPVVKRGCMEFYREKDLKQDPKDLFTQEVQEELCKMLDDHYRKDVLKGEYHSKL